MAPNKTPQTLTREITQFILSKSEVHYRDIIDFTGMSRKTVAKYLDRIELEVQKFQVKLVRKRGQGIYFEGDKKRLLANFSSFDFLEHSDKFRKLDIMLFLIRSKHPILLEDLAEKFFISRSTLERDLNALRESYGFILKSDIKGIRYSATEIDVRKIMGQILQQYWGQEVQQNEKTGRIKRIFKTPKTLHQYVNEEILEETQKILTEFISNTSMKVNEYQYEALLVHTTIAIQRIIRGEYVPYNSQIVPGVISKNTKNLVGILAEKFKCGIPKEEVHYLNMHIVAIEEGYFDVHQTEIIESSITNWLRNNLTEYDDQLLRNLMLHLEPALKRAGKGISIKNPYREKIKTNFPTAFINAVDLSIDIQKQYRLLLTEDEISYLALHFESFIERNKVNAPIVKAIIVCSTGYGTAALLKQRINDKFPEIKVVATLSVGELLYSHLNVDIIISTVPIKMNSTRVIQVSPFLNNSELGILEKISHKTRKEKYIRRAFVNLISSKGVIANTGVKNREEAIELIAEQLYEYGFVDEKMTESALKREKLASTVIDDIAIPHGDMKHVIHPVIGILTSKVGIDWDGETVHVVFFIALNQIVKNEIDDIYSYFYELIQTSEKMERLVNAEQYSDVLNCFSVTKSDV